MSARKLGRLAGFVFVLAAVFGFKGIAETRNNARPGRSRAILGIVLAGGTVLVAVVFFFVAIIAVMVGMSPPGQQ